MMMLDGVGATLRGNQVYLQSRQELATRFIYDERHWLERPLPPVFGDPAFCVFVSRWSRAPGHHCDARAEIDSNYHVIAIALRTMTLSIFAKGRLVHDGLMAAGAAKVNLPSQSLRAVFKGPSDILHLHIPNKMMSQCMATGRSQERCAEITDRPIPSDPVVDRLARSLIRAEGSNEALNQLCTGSIALAITARVLSRSLSDAAPGRSSSPSQLPMWRLKRTFEFVETHLDEPVGLSEMAASAGLSRMHFAAQFRAALGIRPHEYLQRRRVERAQDLLAGSNRPLVDVALGVGFKSQAHFTTVFARLTGETPNNWRRRAHLLRTSDDATSGSPTFNRPAR